MICTSIQNKTYEQILDILEYPELEMAEIRLDLCSLGDEEIEDIFSNSNKALLATCRISDKISPKEAERRLKIAIEAGARFADLEIEAPASMSKNFQKYCHQNGTEIIRSYHNFDTTPEDEVLQMALARCFRYGADIAKIVCKASDKNDCERLLALYSCVLEDVPTLQGKLIAFGMGEAGQDTRLECLKRGAPFSYASINQQDATAPGQLTAEEMFERIYENKFIYNGYNLKMPASKSFAQRAILAAALAKGTSKLSAYSPCEDSQAAIALARQLGAIIIEDNETLTITGIDAHPGSLNLQTINTGESGLLTRLAIPLLSVLNSKDFTVQGRGTLLNRPLKSAAEIMAAFGVLLTNQEHEGKEVFIPAKVSGRLISGNADIPGSGGSQLISGLLMALPLCDSDSKIFVTEPKSIPYMYITLDVMRHFGVQSRSEMEGDVEMIEAKDWSYCSGITFKTKGSQIYHGASFEIERDWSAAANFLVAGAIFGSAEIANMDMSSLQADLTIVDILVEAGAVVSQLEDDTICVCKAPLEAFNQDLNNAPDLFPIAAILAAFCSGESHIEGVGRLVSKESNRAEAILQTLEKMGVEAFIEGDTMIICGESLCSRILAGRLLKGGAYSSFHDHRMFMALKVAALGSDSPIIIDDESCVSKSFPGFTL